MNTTTDGAMGEGAPPEPSMMRFGPMANPYVVGVATAVVLDGPRIEATIERLERHGTDDYLNMALRAATEQANNGFFHFDLSGLHEGPGPLLCRWGVDEPGWGLSREHSTRKLVLIVPLRVRSGDGTVLFRFPHLGREERLTAGMVIMYPAFLQPEVHLEGGDEMVLAVTHALGDAFR